MQIIGCHLSVAKGFLAMGEEAVRLGANTFQFFTRNPRGSKAKAWDQEDIDAYQALAEAKGFGVILAHAPYTLNLCSKEEKTRPSFILFSGGLLDEHCDTGTSG